MKAVWNHVVLAESDNTILLEGNHYFPLESIVPAHFEPSTHTSVCSWKGTAKYYSIAVDGKRNDNAAWYYPDPKDAAKSIQGRVAFWKGVQITA
jgi:uncharacterized protein (DUF427 family)